MYECYIGSVVLFAGNFAPKGWAFCNGQILPIAQSTALFSLLGTTYGGNGTTTFALPDFRGRVPVSQGQGPGRNPVDLGEMGGSETATITVNQMPSHNHTVNVPAGEAQASSDTPGGNILTAQNTNFYAEVATADNGYGGVAAASSGGNQPIDVRPPSLALNYIIALQGVFPSRQ